MNHHVHEYPIGLALHATRAHAGSELVAFYDKPLVDISDEEVLAYRRTRNDPQTIAKVTAGLAKRSGKMLEEMANAAGAVDIKARFVGVRAAGDEYFLDVSVRGAVTSLALSREDYERMRGTAPATKPWGLFDELLRIAKTADASAGDVLGAAKSISEVATHLEPEGVVALLKDIVRAEEKKDLAALAAAASKLTRTSR